jgi:hypothetical protein
MIRHVLLAGFLATTSACSSTPRAFVAEVQPPPPDKQAFDGMFVSCADEVAAGRKENFQTGQIDPGQATGAVAATAGAALIYGGASAGVWAGVGAVGAGSILVMLAPVAWVGVSAAVRSSREHAVQQAMGACLQQNGYTVTRWRTPTKEEIKAGSPTTPTAPRKTQPAS